LLQQTSIASRFIQDQLLPQNTMFPTYQGIGNRKQKTKLEIEAENENGVLREQYHAREQ